MTDQPVIPDEAIEAAAKAMFADEHCDKRQMADIDGNWNSRLNDEDQALYRSMARAALAAALPHLRPLVEVATSGLQEALERTLGSLPVMTYDTVHHLDPGYRTQAMPKAQLLDLLALHPAHDEAETKALCETATQVALKLGRQEALADGVAAIERSEDDARRAEERTHDRGWSDIATGYMRSAEILRGIGKGDSA